MRRLAWMPMLVVGMLSLCSCAQWNGLMEMTTPDSKKQATDRWRQVRSQLKLRLASDQFKVGHIEEAKKFVSEAIQLDPTGQPAYVLMTKIQLEQGETAQAVETLELAMTYGEESAETNYLQGVLAERYGRFDEALTSYQRAFDLDPLNAHYLAATAETLVALDRAAEALTLVRSRWTDFEQNATLRALAGGVYTLLGRHEDAANAYAQACRISPDDHTMRRQLANALFQAERYEEAAREYETLAASDNVSAGVLVGLGRCYLELNRPNDAKHILQQAVDKDPARAQAWHWLARTALMIDDLLTARRAITQAQQLEPSETEHALLLGYICVRQEDYAASARLLTSMLDEQSSDPMALAILAMSHRGLGQEQEAERCLDKVKQRHPQFRLPASLLDHASSSEGKDHQDSGRARAP